MKTFVNTANKGTLNMRAEPSSNAKVLARIPYGTELEVKQTTSEWSQTIYDGKTGYVMNKFLEDKAKIITKDDLKRVYDSLSQSLKLIEKLIK